MKKTPAAIIALGFVISAIILGHCFYYAQKSVNTIRVVGYASGEYDSDILRWRITLTASASSNNLMAGHNSLNTDIRKLRDFLGSKGFDPTALEISASWNYPNYNRDGNITGYTFEQNVSLTIRDVTRFDEVETLAYEMTELAKTGINLKGSSVEYFISALPELKQEIIAEATKDARERAAQVASTTNTKLGKLRNGRVGVFQITEPLSTEVQSYGIYDANTRRKQISVTMTGEFELK